jgi:hypothetical protein
LKLGARFYNAIGGISLIDFTRNYVQLMLVTRAPIVRISKNFYSKFGAIPVLRPLAALSKTGYVWEAGEDGGLNRTCLPPTKLTLNKAFSSSKQFDCLRES